MGKPRFGVAPTCGHEGRLRANGFCDNCYQKKRYERMPKAMCHPERREHCKGLCRQCYADSLDSNRATCHPDRLHVACGLCRQCYQALPENIGRAVQVRRMAKYGLTEKEYVSILLLQGWVCAICEGEPTDVDHDHVTGRVRGILCRACNTGIGHFEDDPMRLEAAASYLRSNIQQEIQL